MRKSPRAIPNLIEDGMGPELHWFPEDVSASNLAETFAGMANTTGGQVLIGISPRGGKLLGLQDPEAAVDLVFQAALLTEPPLVLPLPALETVGEWQLLRVSIPPGLPHIYTISGRYLGREGRHNAPLSAGVLRRKLIERGALQYEARCPVEAELDDLDDARIAAYLDGLPIGGSESPQEILLRRGCLVEEAGQLRPTYAALLLFGKTPQRWVPNALILAARFSGASVSDVFIKEEISGTLPEQLQRAERFFKENVRTSVRLQGLVRDEAPEYPPEAVRELLVNAVAHRDYSLQGDSIHLHLFSSRLEVHSPGLLPGPVTLDNLLEARYSRNPIIVQVLSDMGFIERLGYGLDRAVRLMEEHGLSPPAFAETAGTFRVTLSSTARSREAPKALAAPSDRYRLLGLSPRQEQALEFLAAHERITNSDFQGLCPEVHQETLRRDLADLVKKQILLKIGSKRGTYYILKKEF